MSSLAIGSTNNLELADLRDRISLAYPQDATVVVTLYDAVGAAVVGATALACPWVAPALGLSGVYRAIAPSTVVLTAQTYTAKYTATTTGGVVRVFSDPCPAS